MAARKKKTQTRALARTNRSALALPDDLADEFAPYLNRDKASAAAAGGWPWISTQGSSPVMRIGERELGGADGLTAIVLGGLRANLYYDQAFQPGVFTPPKCWAVADPSWTAAEVEEKLAPPADLATKESEKCQGCPMNAFGSHPSGRRRKACSNTVRLALLPADAADYSKVDGCMLSVPPTSLKLWGEYADHVINGLGRHVATVVTRIRKVVSERGQGFTLAFEPASPSMEGFLIQDRDTLGAILGRVKGDGTAALVQPPPQAGADSGPAQGAPRQRRRKVHARKK